MFAFHERKQSKESSIALSSEEDNHYFNNLQRNREHSSSKSHNRVHLQPEQTIFKYNTAGALRSHHKVNRSMTRKHDGGANEHNTSTISIYDEDYWHKKAEALVQEKITHLSENFKLR